MKRGGPEYVRLTPRPIFTKPSPIFVFIAVALGLVSWVRSSVKAANDWHKQTDKL